MAQSRSPRRLLKDALAALDRLAEVLARHEDAREQVGRALAAGQIDLILASRHQIADAVQRLAAATPAPPGD